MTDDEIHDEIRMSTDSSIQALTALVRDLQNDNRKHRQEELESRELYREKLIQEVRLEMKAQFNGKMDSITKKVDTLGEQQVLLLERSEPVLTQFEERKGFWTTMSNYSKSVGLIAALVGGGVIIFKYLAKLSELWGFISVL